MLEAFQLSAGAVAAHGRAAPGLLRAQLAGRLAATPAKPALARWLREQAAAGDADAASAAARGRPRARGPSLDQAGGLARLALRGHAAADTRVALAPSGTEVITGFADGTARVWDLEVGGDCVLDLRGHAGGVTALACTADGSLLLTASEDGTLRAHELERGECLRELKGHVGAVADAALWDLRSGARRASLRGAHAAPARWAALSADGARLATASPDRRVAIWDAASGELLGGLPALAGSRVKSFAAGGALRRCALALFDGSVVVHDLVLDADAAAAAAAADAGAEDGAVAAAAPAPRWLQRRGDAAAADERPVHRSGVNEVLLSADGATAVTLSKDATARVWDAASGACLRVLAGHGDALAGGRLIADDALLATWALDASVRLWDVASGACLAALPMPAPVVAADVAPRGGRRAAALADGSLALWDAAAPARCARIPAAHGGSDVASVAFSADGALLASAAADGTARLWAPAAGGALAAGLYAADAALTAVHLDGAAGTLVAADERGVVHFVDARPPPPPLNE